MRRNSIVLAFLKMVFLSAVVVKAGQLRSRQFVTKNNSQNDEKTPNHETSVENKEPEEHQNGRIGRKLERKKIRIHKHSVELEKKRTWRRNHRLKEKQIRSLRLMD